MSMKQCVSEMMEVYTKAHGSYHDLRQLRKNAILKIRSISSDIQYLEIRIKDGNIACSKVSIVSGVLTIAGILGAPFTAGGSLGLTAIGTGLGLGTGVAHITQTWANSSK